MRENEHYERAGREGEREEGRKSRRHLAGVALDVHGLLFARRPGARLEDGPHRAGLDAEPEPVPVAPTCDEFAPQFAELALTMPQSVRKQVAARLLKKKLNPIADDLDDAAAELIQEALRHAHAVYARKRDRAAIASAAKRVMVKASKVAEKPDVPEKEEVVEA